MGAAGPMAVKEPDGAYAISPPVSTTPPSGSAIEGVVGAAQREPETARAPQQPQPLQVVETPFVTAEPVAVSAEFHSQVIVAQGVQQVWGQLLQAISHLGRQRLERTCKPLRFENATMVFAWLPDASPWMQGEAEQVWKQTRVKEALAKIVGQPVQVRYDTVDRPATTHATGPGANGTGHGGNANGKAPPAVRRDAAPRDTFVDDAERALRGLHTEPKRP